METYSRMKFTSLLLLVHLVGGLFGNALTFNDLLRTFSECSITYYDRTNRSISENYNMTGTLLNLKSRFGLIPLQFMSTLNSATHSKLLVAFNLLKHSECKVLVLPGEQLQLPRDLQNREVSSVKFEFYAEFVWFLKPVNSNSYLNHITPGVAYSEFLKSHKPAVYMEIEEFQRVSLICIPCMKQASSTVIYAVPLNVSDHQLISQIRSCWFTQHQNLWQIGIGMDIKKPWSHDEISKYFHQGQTTPCSIYPEIPSSFDPPICALIIMRDTLNFSFASDKRSQSLTHSKINFKNFINNLFLRRWKASGIMMSSYGISLEQYGFIVLHDNNLLLQDQAKMKGILSPFPRWVWITIAILGISTSLVTACRIDNLGNWTCQNFFQSIFLLSSVLVEQTASRIPGKDGLRKRFLVATWAFFCIIVAYAYRAFLFTALASKMNPFIPETIFELRETGMLMGTKDWFWQTGNNTFTSRPTIMQGILPKIVSSEKNITKRGMYGELQTSIVWFTCHEDIDQFAINTSFTRKALVGPSKNIMYIPYLRSVLDSNRSTLIPSNSREIGIPNKFAIIDLIETIECLKIFFEELGTLWVSRPVAVHKFINHLVWSVQNNHLFPTITLSLARLYESGLYNRWDMYFIENEKKVNRAKLRKLNAQVELSLDSGKEHQISKGVFLEILIHFCIFLAAGLLSFVIEHLHQFGKKKNST